MAQGCSAIFGDEFTRHDMGRHEENRNRFLLAIAGLPEWVIRRDPVPAEREDLERVHNPRHIRMIEQFCAYGGVHYLDMDTYVTGDSFHVASLAAGSAIKAAEYALSGEHSFALVRPPGHHAEPDRAMGYCLFNNAAVAAAWALERVERVAIVDWDLHHGNGTQKIFYASDRVLFCSVHLDSAFPWTGWVDEIGEGRGRGFNLNAPLRSGATIDDYSLIFREVFNEAIRHFSPDLLIISAGQDPLADDPKEGMKLYPEDFGTLTRLLMEAYPGAVALVLEGGYGPSLGKAIREIFSALEGTACAISPGRPRESTRKVVEQLTKVMI